MRNHTRLPIPTSNRIPRTTPQPKPQPIDTTALVGTWRTMDGGVVIMFGQKEYQVYLGGNLADRGMYRVEGRSIFARTAAGNIEEVIFILNGNQLTLTWKSNGQVLQFIRSR